MGYAVTKEKYSLKIYLFLQNHCDHFWRETQMNQNTSFIRSYNNCFAVSSSGAKDATLPGWKATCRIQGQVYHRIGSLQPLPNELKQFLQIYFIEDYQKQAETRRNISLDLKFNTILDLQEFLHNHNPYVEDFKLAMQRAGSEDFQLIIRADKTLSGEHERRFNAPQQMKLLFSLLDKTLTKTGYTSSKTGWNTSKGCRDSVPMMLFSIP